MAVATSKYERIAAHGRNLLVIFPQATERDPVKLCKKLRRLEKQAEGVALRLCNGPQFEGGEEEVDTLCENILGQVCKLLGNQTSPAIPIFINRDPRGYQLKIRVQAAEKMNIHHDWGGYGIIAPEIK